MIELAPILIVDDEPECIEIAEQLVHRAGVANPVIVRNSAEAAVEYLQQCLAGVVPFEPALILLDVRMPGADGLEVLDWVRRHHEFDRTRVIMWSASASQRQINAALRRGAHAFFTKFPEHHVAGAAIRAALNLHRNGVSAAASSASRRS